MKNASPMNTQHGAERQQLLQIIRHAFPHQTLHHLDDCGYWVNEEDYRTIYESTGEQWRGKRIVKFQLQNGERYCVKLANPDDEWENDFTSELVTYAILSQQTTIPVPEVVTVDCTQRLIATNYLILSELSGVKLCTVWLQSDERTKLMIARELGRTYSKIHAVKGKQSGIFKTVKNPYDTKFPVHPNDVMLEQELRKGSGVRAVREQIIPERTYQRVIALWEEHLDFLKDHTPTLIHYNAFCWAIALQYSDSWTVSRLTGGGMMWWDPALDLALMKYPPFMQNTPAHWEAFQAEYEGEIDEQRIALYGLFTTLLAAMGVYYEPPYLRNPIVRNRLNDDLEQIMSSIT